MQSGGLWTVLKGGLIYSPSPTPTWAAKWRSRGLTLMNDERRAYDLRPQHDDHQHPAPEVSDSTSREGKAIPLPVMAGGNASPAPDVPPPDMVKTVGGTTFDIYFHFSQTSRETFTDKVLRLIQSDVVTS